MVPHVLRCLAVRDPLAPEGRRRDPTAARNPKSRSVDPDRHVVDLERGRPGRRAAHPAEAEIEKADTLRLPARAFRGRPARSLRNDELVLDFKAAFPDRAARSDLPHPRESPRLPSQPEGRATGRARARRKDFGTVRLRRGDGKDKSPVVEAERVNWRRSSRMFPAGR